MSPARALCSSLLLLAFIAMPGCVERKEHLTITPGGSVLYRIEYKSDSADDLYGGDAVPRLADGWIAAQNIERDENGKETYILAAQMVFPAGVKLPSHYASRTDPDADLFLQFPTTLTFEQRRDGTYYHFSRAYSARPWAVINSLRERIVEAPLEELKDIEPAHWTQPQLMMVARALATFEVEKMLLLARGAFKQATPDVPQDGWLAVQDHMRDCLNHLDYQRIARLIEWQEQEPEDELRQNAVNAELKVMADLLDDQLKQGLFTLAGFNGSQYNLFMMEFDRRMKALAVTEDLGDDRFEIIVEMPGQIVATNADEVGGSTVKWTFDGQIIRDRELELMVTSRVAR